MEDFNVQSGKDINHPSLTALPALAVQLQPLVNLVLAHKVDLLTRDGTMGSLLGSLSHWPIFGPGAHLWGEIRTIGLNKTLFPLQTSAGLKQLPVPQRCLPEWASLLRWRPCRRSAAGRGSGSVPFGIPSCPGELSVCLLMMGPSSWTSKLKSSFHETMTWLILKFNTEAFHIYPVIES